MLTTDDLPDDVLLAIFDFCVFKNQDPVFFDLYIDDTKRKIESWQSLVHVCRRWRGLVFGSPRRLDLQLYCTTRTPAGKILDVWPALPLLIMGGVYEGKADNVIAELKLSDRIYQIQLELNRYTTQIEELWTAMQVPFPELAVLSLSFGDMSHGPALPDLFLGGSASRLRYLALSSISFPGLPKLLLSCAHLVYLCLLLIPLSGYFSPEAMATCLPMLTSLETLRLEFDYSQPPFVQESRLPPPPTRSVLPALTRFWFTGVTKYLEGLVSRIDAPRLFRMSTTFADVVDFDTPELNQFIRRTPRFKAYHEARLIFHRGEALVRLQSHPYLGVGTGPRDHGMVEVKILCQVPDRQFSFLAHICTLSLRLLLTMEHLYIYEHPFQPPGWRGAIELDLLLPFTAVKNLYLSKKFTRRIAPSLQELAEERTTEVLPALQNILLEKFRPFDPVEEGIAHFISARQLTNHPVAISLWDR